jgi:hypothetical protein
MSAFKILAVLVCLSIGYCAIPTRKVLSLTVRLQDQNGVPLSGAATAMFFDKDGHLITKVAGDSGFQWVHWWASSEYPEKSILTPADALRATEATIEAPGCESLTIPIALSRNYQGLSCMPHGGGPAYSLYKLETTVRLKCGSSNE